MKIFSLALFLCVLFSSCDQKLDFLYVINQKVKVGDHIEWSSLTYNDSSWQERARDFPNDSIFWFRKHFELKNLPSYSGLGLRVGSMSSYEFYWDGVLIDINGTRINHEGGSDGNYIHFIDLPDSLTLPGRHIASMRSIQPYSHLGHHAFMVLGNFEILVTKPIQISKYMFLIGGVFIAAALYFLFLFFSRPSEFSTLLFSLICIVFLGLVLFEYLKLFQSYSYPFQRTRLVIIGYSHVALSLLIPMFFAMQFDFPWKKTLLGIIVVLILYFEIYYLEEFDWLALTENKIMWIASFTTVAYGVWERRKEAYIVLIGFVCSLAVFLLIPYFSILYVSSFDVSLFLSFLIIVVSMLYVYTYKRKEELLAYEASIVLSESLKSQLLRKNIKPHFIMNTLTSLIDWVEESPKEGVKFIHALADEFRVLNDMADHKLIPIEQEINLCRSHLKVMSYRKEVNYIWKQTGIDPNEIIPPAIIHTAVENGVTHSEARKNESIVFTLSFVTNSKYKQYVLLVSGSEKEMESRQLTITREGTGSRYIKSRLKENYNEDWSYESKLTSKGWLTTITIYPK